MNLDDLEYQFRNIRWPATLPVLRSEVLAIISAARERDALRAEVERLKAELADRTEVCEKHVACDRHADAWEKAWRPWGDGCLECEVERLKADNLRLKDWIRRAYLRMGANTVLRGAEPVPLSDAELAPDPDFGLSVDTAGMTPTADTDGHTGGWPIRTEHPYGKGGAR